MSGGNSMGAGGRVRWDVDDRPASLWTRAYVLGMRAMRDKSAFEGAARTRATARKRQRSGDAPPTLWTRLVTEVAPVRVGTAQRPVWRVRRRGEERPSARVLYVHGGGYVHTLTADYWRLVRSLTRGGAEVVVPTYPLAPDATIDDALPWLLDVERATRPADGLGVPTVLMGDSAGGALILVLARELATQHYRPDRLVALCPWLDATFSEPEVAHLEATDPMLAESGLRAAGRWWAGRRSPGDPLVSPLNAELDGLPPLDVFIGDRDILRPAVDDLAERARAQDIDLHVHETPAMFHVWMTRAIPEGRRTRRALADLVASVASGPSSDSH